MKLDELKQNVIDNNLLCYRSFHFLEMANKAYFNAKGKKSEREVKQLLAESEQLEIDFNESKQRFNDSLNELIAFLQTKQ